MKNTTHSICLNKCASYFTAEMASIFITRDIKFQIFYLERQYGVQYDTMPDLISTDQSVGCPQSREFPVSNIQNVLLQLINYQL